MGIYCKNTAECENLYVAYTKVALKGSLSLLALLGFILSASAQIECYKFENATDIESFGYTDWDRTSPGYRSSFSLKSGVINQGETSRIFKEVIGPANISFYWKAEEYHKWDGTVRTNIGKFSFLVNDTVVDLDRKADGWNKKEIYLGDGKHQLEWKFQKYSVGKSIPESAGSGWIDDVCISGIETRILKPTTEGPTTEGPATEGPTTEGPTTEGPTTEGPTTEGPTTEGPATSELYVIPISPNDGKLYLLKSMYNTEPLKFEFMFFDPSANNQKANCCLCISNDSEEIKWKKCKNVATNMKHNISYNFLRECDYSWNITCFDENGTVYISRNKTIQVKKDYFNKTTYIDHCNDPYNYTYDSFDRAIDHVEPNGRVIIRDGIYEENLIINKSIVVTSNNRNTVIRPKNVNDFAIKTTENNVIIENITIIGGIYGICLESCLNCIVRDVTVSEFEELGIYLDNCQNSIIDNSSINSVKNTGIYLVDSNNCRITNNIIDNIIMANYGICIFHSNKNGVSNNYIRNTDDGIKLNEGSWGNIIEANNKYIRISGCHIYARDCGENEIPPECGSSMCKKCP